MVWQPEIDQIAKRRELAKQMGGPERVAEQHEREHLTVRERIDLRHAAASFMLAQGVPMRVVMETLGHSQIGVTMNIYSHVMPDLQRSAADRVMKVLWG